MPTSELNEVLAKRLRDIRRQRGVASEEFEKRLLLGEGWLAFIESGAFPLTLDFVAAALTQLNSTFDELFIGIDPAVLSSEMTRRLVVVSGGEGLLLRFPYGDFDAEYILPRAAMGEFDEFFSIFRQGVALGKSDAVTNSFLAAVALWPQANPADLWNFLIHQAFCDPLNHPPSEIRRDFEQSWKRTAGWALERVLVRFYEHHLSQAGIHLEIPKGARKAFLVSQLQTTTRLEADKIDVFLVGDVGLDEVCFGAVHVKASFAERRTDDVPMSRALIEAGYVSPLWTLDSKATPGARPFNRGELGALLSETSDVRSAKRKDFEVDGYFSACFSYNRNTKPTPNSQNAVSRVYACDFSNPDDQFSQWLIESWAEFKEIMGLD